MFGTKEKADKKKLAELESLLLEGETINSFHPALVDYCAFTDMRLIFVDTSITSKRRTLVSIPYRNILTVGLEKGGMMNPSKTVVIAVSGNSYDLQLLNTEVAKDIYKKVLTRIL